MVPENDSSVFGRMKRGIRLMTSGFDFSSAESTCAEEGMNVTAQFARCDAACDALRDLMKEKIFAMEHTDRSCFYARAVMLINEVIGTLDTVHAEIARRTRHPEDPAMPLFLTIRELLKMLKKTADVSGAMNLHEKGIESFAGISAVAKMRIIDDAVSDLEVSLMHNVSALFDQLEGPVRRGREQRKRAFSRGCQERYAKAFSEYTRHFALNPETLKKFSSRSLKASHGDATVLIR